MSQTPETPEVAEKTACSTVQAPCSQADPYAELPASMPRRLFMQGLIGLFAATWAAVVAFPLLRYLWPKEEVIAEVNSLVVGKVADIPVGTGKNIKFGPYPALVVHNPDGSFHAFNAKCTHLGCTVQYKEDMGQIYCACHGGTYDATSGKNIAGPPPKPLTVFKVDVVKDEVIISKA